MHGKKYQMCIRDRVYTFAFIQSKPLATALARLALPCSELPGAAQASAMACNRWNVETIFAESEPKDKSLHRLVRVGLVFMLLQSLLAVFVMLERLPPLLIKLVCQYRRSASNWSARELIAAVTINNSATVQVRIVFHKPDDALIMSKGNRRGLCTVKNIP